MNYEPLIPTLVYGPVYAALALGLNMFSFPEAAVQNCSG